MIRKCLVALDSLAQWPSRPPRRLWRTYPFKRPALELISGAWDGLPTPPSTDRDTSNSPTPPSTGRDRDDERVHTADRETMAAPSAIGGQLEGIQGEGALL